MGFKRDIKVKKVNRTFNINVRLYHNSESYNRTYDATPRYYLEPVKLNYVERAAFTETGGKAKDYIKIANRQWGGIHEDDLTDEQIEFIYSQIKSSFPYGYVTGNEASEKKYLIDFKGNHSYQSHLEEYWVNHQDEIVERKKDHLGNYTTPYPYVEISNIDEVIKYKYTEGTVPEVMNDATYDPYTTSSFGDVQARINPTTNCAPDVINISVVPYQGHNVFAQGYIEKPIYSFKVGETYTFNMATPWSGNHPLQFSSTYDGTHTSGVGWTGVEYTDGVTKNTSVSGEGYASYNVSIDITSDTPDPLFFYCPNHGQMGGWGFIDNNCDPTLGLPLVVTSLENGVLIGESSLNIHNSNGFYAGNSIVIESGNVNQETVTVKTVTNGILNLLTPLTKNHDINSVITSPNRSGVNGAMSY